ncbi:MAG: biopolymer transporter ExbD [Verrucomicrobia bacterium CG_4_10_14_3_um_filter_43_23]|nr:MAG: hypothetical protein AUJ82_07515 [Verrucomicrobia bacterium CG1_02_43_26]PIP58622.1 MAG: biopolymer transporter TolR [Verrucomicrobia bacterium CG22_combo_CG10-13_8_21_14_all_43_17]PIX58378.1 MAG: biopolymer transporter ExbD [Verrucomicrobia bacterium CG_4_10_14_3_um_filter_43_23]PIY61216.1 MAG: biopolymer transporter ExbD [Verrucomicrobia bacterium CG_4_10_14_0_8_um_filter_43_34]PJA44969.1 MAG: biopolymer transporter ExbD [Verrucomicrobia bacterium CG_4_9_14_3_um_filter_43_20]
MKLQLKKRPSADVNIVPLVDVLIVLIFFFMITMQFRNENVLNITPPDMETAGRNQPNQQLTIGIDKQGTYYFQDVAVGEKDLSALIKDASSKQKQSVLIVSDQDTALKYTTQVMDLCRINGLDKIRLQTR